MADFNPIRDLRSPEADPFNVPAGQSTQEVEDMRLRLVLTREKTENIVKIIKNKGLVFKKDVEKIQELQRRLRTTIPRIPILRGDASTQIGSQVGVQKKGMSGLDFSRFWAVLFPTSIFQRIFRIGMFYVILMIFGRLLELFFKSVFGYNFGGCWGDV